MTWSPMNPALLYKLRAYGVCGKTYNLILSEPSMTDQVKVYEWDIFVPPKYPSREKRSTWRLSIISHIVITRSSLTTSFLNRGRDYCVGNRRLRIWCLQMISWYLVGRQIDRLEELLDGIISGSGQTRGRCSWVTPNVEWCYLALLGRMQTIWREREWILQGKPIAVVEEYTYLPRSEDYSRFEWVEDDGS